MKRFALLDIKTLQTYNNYYLANQIDKQENETDQKKGTDQKLDIKTLQTYDNYYLANQIYKQENETDQKTQTQIQQEWTLDS